MKKIFTLILLLGVAFACKNPDQVGEEDSYCTGGASVTTVDDSNVETAVKNKIYRPVSGSTVLNKNHPSFNTGGRLVLIPVSFTDVPANTRVTNDVIDQAFFSSGTGSVRDYFYENSWGQFVLNKAGVSNLVPLNRTKASYATPGVPDYTRNANLYRDACQGASIDWASLDRNNDQVLTPDEVLVALIIADGGQGAYRPNNVTITHNGRTYQLRLRFVTLDCSKASDSSKQGVETFAYNYTNIWHELAHGFFGLEDLYEGGIAGTGKAGDYDIMDNNYNVVHMSIIAKMKIGWVQPKILLPAADRLPSGLKCYTFTNIETDPNALVLYHENSPDECFIIENRSKAGSARNFNVGLPTEGLAIWWLNTTTGAFRLIDASLLARNTGLRPMEYGTPSANALFKYKEADDPKIPIPLRNQNGQLVFTLRAVSPVGTTMRIEL
ncbi:MAG: hypothetical protein ACI35V_08150 [Sphingobacterium composti]|uniref:hypothetical protein n=1 Tax=Sphingobacterium composti TaxID=363260 RepID=UPI001359CAEF|nr:hypothetical protein [Sphingobacterium composti Ten et al. 2007 non Yoo et al. 2007]